MALCLGLIGGAEGQRFVGVSDSHRVSDLGDWCPGVEDPTRESPC